jgi:hypothetical protein
MTTNVHRFLRARAESRCSAASFMRLCYRAARAHTGTRRSLHRSGAPRSVPDHRSAGGRFPPATCRGGDPPAAHRPTHSRCELARRLACTGISHIARRLARVAQRRVAQRQGTRFATRKHPHSASGGRSRCGVDVVVPPSGAGISGARDVFGSLPDRVGAAEWAGGSRRAGAVRQRVARQGSTKLMNVW